MKRYRLKKDLPTFKTSDEFELNDNGNLYMIDPHMTSRICAYTKDTLSKFPNVLKDWFEEIRDRPKTVWDLEKGDRHYFIGGDGYIDDAAWDGDEIDELHRSMGNVFLTREDAEKEVARRKAKVILERDTKGFKVDDNTERFYYVYYDFYDSKFRWESWTATSSYGHFTSRLVFGTGEDAVSSIKNHEKEWRTYLGVEDGD